MLAAVRRRHTDNHIVLPRQAHQQQRPGGKQVHEQRGALLRCQRAQPCGQRAVKHQRHEAATVILDRWTFVIGRQLQQYGCTAQRFTPVTSLRFQHFARQPLALPDCVIHVLDRQGRQWVGLFVEGCFVQHPQLTRQHAHRPAIRNDVVLGQQEHVIVFGQLHQADAHQRPDRQVERPAALLVHQLKQTRLGIRLAMQFDDRQCSNRPRRSNPLPPLTLDGDERGTQRLMAGHQPVETALQCSHLQRSAQAQIQRHVIGRFAALHLRQKPQPLLGRRQRVCAATLYDCDGRTSAARGAAQLLSKLLQHGGGKQRRRRHVQTQCLPNLGQHAHHQQRVAAKRKKVILTTDPLHAQHLGPDRHECRFQRALSRLERVLIERIGTRFRQCTTVQLAVGGQRQRVHAHKRCGDHVVRQAELQVLAKAFRRQPCISLFVKIGDQPGHTDAVLTQHHQVVTHAGNFGQTRLDFTQLQTQTTQLGLRVITPEKFQVAVCAITRQVAGAVQALTGHERAVDKAFKGQLRQVQIAACDTCAADIQLPRNTWSNLFGKRIEQVNPCIGQRPPDGQHRINVAVAIELKTGAVDACFSDPIGLNNLHALATQPAQLPRAMGSPDVRPADHRAHERQVVPRLLGPDQQRVEHRRHEVRKIDARLAQQAIQRARVHQRVARAQNKRAAKAQCANQIGAEHIEGKPGHLQVIEGFVQCV